MCRAAGGPGRLAAVGRRGTVRGAVAAGSVATAEAAAEVLRAGGNAVDAIVAAAFAACVAEPILASPGGGGFCLVRTAAGAEVLVDGFVAMPGMGGPPHDPAAMDSVRIEFGSATQVFHVGAASVAVPGFVPLLSHLAARFGSWGAGGFADLVAPAVQLAGSGVEVDATFDRVLGLVWPIVSRTVEGRALFGRDGTAAGGPLGVGDRFRAEALGAFLADVGVGGRRGLTADDLGRGVTADDVAAYEVIERSPLRARVADAVVVTNPPPSFGGTLVAHGLEELGGSTSPVAVADALRSMVDRRGGLGPGVSKGTTHISVADAEGSLAALTVSNGSGSGEIVAGTGVQLNNMLGEEDLHPGGLGSLAPGERIGSMMAPMVVELAGGGLVAAGSGGSERIRSALLQLVVDVAGRGRPLGDAVSAPRAHWDGSVLQVEGGLGADELAELAAWGPVNEWPGCDFYFGGVHAVERSASGEWSAVGDARRGGVGIVVD